MSAGRKPGRVARDVVSRANRFIWQKGFVFYEEWGLMQICKKLGIEWCEDNLPRALENIELAGETVYGHPLTPEVAVVKRRWEAFIERQRKKGEVA